MVFSLRSDRSHPVTQGALKSIDDIKGFRDNPMGAVGGVLKIGTLGLAPMLFNMLAGLADKALGTSFSSFTQPLNNATNKLAGAAADAIGTGANKLAGTAVKGAGDFASGLDKLFKLPSPFAKGAPPPPDRGGPTHTV